MTEEGREGGEGGRGEREGREGDRGRKSNVKCLVNQWIHNIPCPGGAVDLCVGVGSTIDTPESSASVNLVRNT